MAKDKYFKHVLDSNWTLEDKKLEMLTFKWLLPIQKSQTLLNEKIAGFELMKMPENKRRSELLELLRPLLRATSGWNRNLGKPSKAFR